jgi:hypothetical protein
MQRLEVEDDGGTPSAARSSNRRGCLMSRNSGGAPGRRQGSGERLGPVAATSFLTGHQWRGGRGATGGGAREDGEVRGSNWCGKEGAGAPSRFL